VAASLRAGDSHRCALMPPDMCFVHRSGVAAYRINWRVTWTEGDCWVTLARLLQGQHRIRSGRRRRAGP
jgi:hypothetical protein